MACEDGANEDVCVEGEDTDSRLSGSIFDRCLSGSSDAGCGGAAEANVAGIDGCAFGTLGAESISSNDSDMVGPGGGVDCADEAGVGVGVEMGSEVGAAAASVCTV